MVINTQTVHTTTFTATSGSGYLSGTAETQSGLKSYGLFPLAGEIHQNPSDIYIGKYVDTSYDPDKWIGEVGVLCFDTDDQTIGRSGDSLPTIPRIRNINLEVDINQIQDVFPEGGGGIIWASEGGEEVPHSPLEGDDWNSTFSDKGKINLEKVAKMSQDDINNLQTARLKVQQQEQKVNAFLGFGSSTPPPEKYGPVDNIIIDLGKIIKSQNDTTLAITPECLENSVECQRFGISGPSEIEPPKLEVKWTSPIYIEWDDDNPSVLKPDTQTKFTGKIFDAEGNGLFREVRIKGVHHSPVGCSDHSGNWTISTSMNELTTGSPGPKELTAKKLPTGFEVPHAPDWVSEWEPGTIFNSEDKEAIHTVHVRGDLHLGYTVPTNNTIDSTFTLNTSAWSEYYVDPKKTKMKLQSEGFNGGYEMSKSVTISDVDGVGTSETVSFNLETSKGDNYNFTLAAQPDPFTWEREKDISIEVNREKPNMTITSGPEYLRAGHTSSVYGSLTTSGGKPLKERNVRYVRKKGEEDFKQIGVRKTGPEGKVSFGITADGPKAMESYLVFPDDDEHERYQQDFSNTLVTSTSLPTNLTMKVTSGTSTTSYTYPSDEVSMTLDDSLYLKGGLTDEWNEVAVPEQEIDVVLGGDNTLVTSDTGSGGKWGKWITVSNDEYIGSNSLEAKYLGGSREVSEQERKYAPISTSTTLNIKKKDPGISMTLSDHSPVPSSSVEVSGYIENALELSLQEIVLEEDKGGGYESVDTVKTGVSGSYSFDNHTFSTNETQLKVRTRWDGDSTWASTYSSEDDVNVTIEDPRIYIKPSTNYPYKNENFSIDGHIISDHGASLDGLSTVLERNSGSGWSPIDTDTTLISTVTAYTGSAEFNFTSLTESSTGNIDYRVKSQAHNNQLSSHTSSAKEVIVRDEPDIISPQKRIRVNENSTLLAEEDIEDVGIEKSSLSKSNSFDISLDNKDGKYTDTLETGDIIDIKFRFVGQNWSDVPYQIMGVISSMDEELSSSGEKISISGNDYSKIYRNKVVDDYYPETGTVDSIEVHYSPQAAIYKDVGATSTGIFSELDIEDSFNFNIWAPEGEKFSRSWSSIEDKTGQKALDEVRKSCLRQTNRNYLYYTSSDNHTEPTFNFVPRIENQKVVDGAQVGSNIIDISREKDEDRVINRVKITGGFVLDHFEQEFDLTEEEWPTFSVSRGMVNPNKDEGYMGKEPEVYLDGELQTKGEDYKINSYMTGDIKFTKSWKEYSTLRVSYWNKHRLHSFDYDSDYDKNVYSWDNMWFSDDESEQKYGRSEKNVKFNFGQIREIRTKNDLKNARKELNEMAQSIIEERKEPYESISVTVPGIIRGQPSQLMEIDYPELNINKDYYRISKMSHEMSSDGFTTSLELIESRPTLDEIIGDVLNTLEGR